MEWVVKKLKSEVSAWNDYKERVRAWQCNTEMDKNAKITEIERRNAELINKTLDLRCPCTEIEKEQVLGVLHTGLGRGPRVSNVQRLPGLLD